MARKYNIRWSDKDQRELQRKVKNFNAKLRRLKKEKPELEGLLPETLSVRNLKKTIQTRVDLKKQFSTIKRFTAKGSEKLVETGEGFQVTKFALDEAKNNVRILNIINSQKRKKAGITPEAGTSRQAKERGIEKREFKVGKTFEEFTKRAESLRMKISSSKQKELLRKYRKNYFKALEQLGAESEEIKRVIGKLSDEELFNKTNANPKLVIDFYYDDNFTQQERAMGILMEWEQVSD